MKVTYGHNFRSVVLPAHRVVALYEGIVFGVLGTKMSV